jgi:hypothetical protein
MKKKFTGQTQRMLVAPLRQLTEHPAMDSIEFIEKLAVIDTNCVSHRRLRTEGSFSYPQPPRTEQPPRNQTQSKNSKSQQYFYSRSSPYHHHTSLPSRASTRHHLQSAATTLEHPAGGTGSCDCVGCNGSSRKGLAALRHIREASAVLIKG